MSSLIESVLDGNLWEKDPIIATALRRVIILQSDLLKAEAQLRALVEATRQNGLIFHSNIIQTNGHLNGHPHL